MAGKKKPKGESQPPARTTPEPSQTPAPPPDDPNLRRGFLVRAEFTGPVPPPEIIQRYEEVYPGAAELIFGAWDTQALHRRTLEERVVEADIRSEWRGLHLSFALAAITIIGGIILIALDKDIYGLAAVLTPLALLAGVYFQAKQQQRRELEEKTPEAPDAPRRLPPPDE